MIDIKSIEKMKKLPNRGKNPCFGCGPSNPYGLRMAFYTDGVSVFSPLSIPGHLCGWNDLAHGGVISTVLDEAMSWAAISLLGRYILTRSMTVDFLRPVWIKRQIVAEARVMEKVNERDAVMEGAIYDDTGALCARSQGRYALFTLEGINRLNLFDAEVLESFDDVFRAIG
ncbi:MAG: PaaI family thioesterase [Spirochaetes bacterium]|nr:PaaI family thioesterase [Spirochaetota bacterium]